MINRINLLLRAKNITARQFAEEIGIQPSGMSHILGGRNNPSLEFVSKVLRRYPEIDANWLLLGHGEMYSSGTPTPASTPAPTSTPSLFSEEMSVASESFLPEEEDVTVEVSPGKVEDNIPIVETSDRPPLPLSEQIVTDGRRLDRILFIYSDKTFQEYCPAR